MAGLSNGLSPLVPQEGAAGGGGPLSYMDAKKQHQQIAHYEGVVRKTAALIEPRVEDDFDEVCQFLREKVWKALAAFSPKRVRTTSKYTPAQQCERFVFACIKNGEKDLLKKKKRNLAFIEDLAPTDTGDGGAPTDSFHRRHLSIEDSYPSIADVPLIPSTLTQGERQVLSLYYVGYTTAEIAVQTATPKKDVLGAAARIREKMADWSPAEGVPMQTAIAA